MGPPLMLAFLKAPAAAAYILAAAQGCPAGPAPELVFDYSVQKTVFNHALSWEELERLRRKNSGTGPLSGLTETKFNHRVAIHGKETSRPDGWHCFRPAKVVVKLEYAPVVYIASGYRPGSCKYKETRRHELQHVEIATATAEEFAPVMMTRLRKAMKELGPQGPGTPRQLRRARDRMNRVISDAYAGAIGEMLRVLEDRQARIDTDSEYQRIAGICAGKKD
jgi:hypothetical protein